MSWYARLSAQGGLVEISTPPVSTTVIDLDIGFNNGAVLTTTLHPDDGDNWVREDGNIVITRGQEVSIVYTAHVCYMTVRNRVVEQVRAYVPDPKLQPRPPYGSGGLSQSLPIDSVYN